ncbi:protein phosphatase 2C domain-containing protein [Actinophytocola sediminis]
MPTDLGWSPLVIGTPVARFEPRPPRSRTYRPDTVVDGWSTGGLVVRGGSVRGYQHRHDGTPRQDDFAIAWHEGTGAVVVAVADGVSEAELAHVGATLACRTAIDQLLRWLDGGGDPGAPDWQDVLRCASWALVEFAAGQPAAGPDEQDAERAERLLATTLVAAVVLANEDGSATVTAARAGDSTAWLLRGQDWTELFAAGDADANGELLATSVTALPRLSAEVATATVTLPADGVLLIGTDGVGVPVGDGRGLVGTALATGVASPPPPLDFGYLLDFSRETFDDDRTLVAVWPPGNPEPT